VGCFGHSSVADVENFEVKYNAGKCQQRRKPFNCRFFVNHATRNSMEAIEMSLCYTTFLGIRKSAWKAIYLPLFVNHVI
jgi:hypothetical protein